MSNCFFKECNSESESESEGEIEGENDSGEGETYQIDEVQEVSKPKRKTNYVLTEARRANLEKMRLGRMEKAKIKREKKEEEKEVELMRKELDKLRKMKAKAEERNELRVYRKKKGNQREIMVELSSEDEEEMEEILPKTRGRPKKSVIVQPPTPPKLSRQNAVDINPLQQIHSIFRN